jgi:hypothetical protein
VGTDCQYEAWKRDRRRAAISQRFHPFEAPYCDPAFEDAGSYLAFATNNGIDSELIFMNPARTPGDQRVRERDLLVLAERELTREARRAITANRFEALALEVRRPNRGHPVFDVGWCGAPATALVFAIDVREFASLALEDVQHRLGNYPRPKLRLPA